MNNNRHSADKDEGKHRCRGDAAAVSIGVKRNRVEKRLASDAG